MSKILHGIDVSKHNGIIDWGKVEDSDIDFAMLRAGYGQNTVDLQFKRNAAECNRLGIPIGVYWFSYATTVFEVIKEAEFCIKTIEKYDIQYPVVFDLEYDTVKYAKSKGVILDSMMISAFAMAFLQVIENAGYKPMLYANPDYIKNMFKLALLTKYDLWLAHYSAKPYCESAIWQYSDKGEIAGISGNVDMNYGYKSYVEATPAVNKLSVEAVSVLSLLKLDNVHAWTYFLEHLSSAEYISWLDELIVKIYKNRKRDGADWLTIIKRSTTEYDAWAVAIVQSVKVGKGMAAYIPQLIEKANDAE